MKAEKISGGYPGGFFLENISFHIEEGNMVALLGLNGSGKTTIIKLFCGLLKAQSGKIFIDDMDILAMNERERARLVSYIPQYSSIAYDTSVMDVVLMGVSPYLGVFRTPGREHIKAAQCCLRELGIDHLADTNYQTLSGGMKQLVIIARALLQNGRYMIFDEPDSSLDLINKNKLMVRIREITKRHKKGCVISMHNPEYALNYCDNIIMLKDKKIAETDLKNEDMRSVEKKLSEVYGNIEIIKYKEKYILYYE